MSRSVREYLKHIRDEIFYLESESAGINKDEFLDDETHKRAFVRSIEVIAEASKNIPEEIRDEYPQIQLCAIAGVRDHLIHGQFGIVYDIVWDVLKNHIPVLAKTIDKILLRKDIDQLPIQTGSKQVPVGAHDQKRPMTVVFDSGESHSDSPLNVDVERFLSLIRFENRENLKELGLNL